MESEKRYGRLVLPINPRSGRTLVISEANDVSNMVYRVEIDPAPSPYRVVVATFDILSSVSSEVAITALGSTGPLYNAVARLTCYDPEAFHLPEDETHEELLTHVQELLNAPAVRLFNNEAVAVALATKDLSLCYIPAFGEGDLTDREGLDPKGDFVRGLSSSNYRFLHIDAPLDGSVNMDDADQVNSSEEIVSSEWSCLWGVHGQGRAKMDCEKIQILVEITDKGDLEHFQKLNDEHFRDDFMHAIYRLGINRPEVSVQKIQKGFRRFYVRGLAYSKIRAVQAVREYLPLGIGEAKRMVESMAFQPVFLSEVPLEQYEEIEKTFTDLGMVVSDHA